MQDSFSGEEKGFGWLSESSPGKTGNRASDYTEAAGELQNLSSPLVIEVGYLLHYIHLLGLTQLRVHRQRQRFLGGLLCRRKAPWQYPSDAKQGCRCSGSG